VFLESVASSDQDRLLVDDILTYYKVFMGNLYTWRLQSLADEFLIEFTVQFMRAIGYAALCRNLPLITNYHDVDAVPELEFVVKPFYQVHPELSSGAPSNALLEFHVIEKCGHLPQDEKPEEVCKFVY
ncbi:1525_t:CDS:2, partial [Diversispora eburnea]